MKRIMVIFLSLFMISTMFGCSNTPVSTGDGSQSKTSSAASSIKDVSSVADGNSSDFASSDATNSEVSETPVASQPYFVQSEAPLQSKTPTQSKAPVVSQTPVQSKSSPYPETEYSTQTVQYNGESITITVAYGYSDFGNAGYYEPLPGWRGPNGESIRVNGKTGEASIYLCDRCGKPYGNGHNGTCLYIIGYGGCHNCDDPNQTCPFCGRYFGNGYNGTCYLTRAEGLNWNNRIDKNLIYCYHYDEGMRYYHGKNPEPIN